MINISICKKERALLIRVYIGGTEVLVTLCITCQLHPLIL